MATFGGAELRDRIRLDSITCVLDAEQVFETPEVEQLKLWQVACADLLILNKVDLVENAEADRVRAWLDDHFHRYRLGGFKWSSQHLDSGGVDGQAGGVDGGVDGAVADEVAGAAVVASGGAAGVLA